MVVVVVVLLLVCLVLGVLLVLARNRVGDVTEVLARSERGRDDADAARRVAEEARMAMARARDDALEREKRARREAADVGRRLHEAHAARDTAEGRIAELETALAERETEFAQRETELAQVQAAADDGSRDAALWELALSAMRRTWAVSVAPSPGLPSPLDETDDALRTAVEIEVDAAREEAGAAIELEWAGDVVQPPAVAVQVLSIAQELVARLAKTSGLAILRVASGLDAVEIAVEAVDAGGAEFVLIGVAPEHEVAPGRYVLRA